jgi:hypothetical protein
MGALLCVWMEKFDAYGCKRTVRHMFTNTVLYTQLSAVSQITAIHTSAQQQQQAPAQEWAAGTFVSFNCTAASTHDWDHTRLGPQMRKGVS